MVKGQGMEKKCNNKNNPSIFVKISHKQASTLNLFAFAEIKFSHLFLSIFFLLSIA